MKRRENAPNYAYVINQILGGFGLISGQIRREASLVSVPKLCTLTVDDECVQFG